MVGHRARADTRRARGSDARKRRVAHRICRKARHIEGTGTVPCFVQPARVCKGCSRHAEHLCLFVHPCDELPAAAFSAAVVGDALCRVVPRGEHQPVEQLLHRERFPLGKIHRRALAQMSTRDRDLFFERAVLQCHKAGHDLCGACDAALLQFIARCDHAPALRLHQNERGGRSLGRSSETSNTTCHKKYRKKQ